MIKEVYTSDIKITEAAERYRIASLMQNPRMIFVFGSNEAGIHGKGAALTAVQQYGAALGRGFGLYGRSYAIPTKDGDLNTLTKEEIGRYVDRFLDHAHRVSRGDYRPLQLFAITRLGCGLAGYRDEDIAPMFRGRTPWNCFLPIGWYE